MDKKQTALAAIEKFIPITFRLQTNLISLIKTSTTNVLELIAFCVTKMIYLRPRPQFLMLRCAYNSDK